MPKTAHTPALVSLRGAVTALNRSPKGHTEGALIRTAKGIVQVNFPKHDAETLAASMKVGAEVALRGELEGDDFDHPVYRLADDEGEVSGTIARLNYALHGEVNGAILSDGTFVHLEPEGAKKARLRVGETIRAKGTRRVGSAGVVVDARSVERPSKAGDLRARA
jgi:hypothetical protein